MSPPLHPGFLKLPKTKLYLLGISGGRDSVALLHLLLENGYHNLVLCHLNHGLRGEESAQDAQLVTDLAEKYDLLSEIAHCDTAALMQEKKESMELAARNARHRFFYDCSVKYDSQSLLLAHHANDQAETILFNLLRGSNGLRGMSFQTQHVINQSTIVFYRPLLATLRDDINSYLEDKKIPYRDDESNTEPIAARNRIRNEVMPLLDEIMGRDVSHSLLRAEHASSLSEIALREILTTYETQDPQGRLFIPTLKELHPALQRVAIHDYLKDHGVPNINNRLLAECLELFNTSTSAKINLPGGSFLRRKEKRLFIETCES